MTGDVLGFSIELSELVVLLTFAVQIQRPLWF
jgi:cobalamin synthase